MIVSCFCGLPCDELVLCLRWWFCVGSLWSLGVFLWPVLCWIGSACAGSALAPTRFLVSSGLVLFRILVGFEVGTAVMVLILARCRFHVGFVIVLVIMWFRAGCVWFCASALLVLVLFWFRVKYFKNNFSFFGVRLLVQVVGCLSLIPFLSICVASHGTAVSVSAHCCRIHTSLATTQQVFHFRGSFISPSPLCQHAHPPTENIETASSDTS